MPKRTDIKKILIIGSGPIVIGQACEFDYSGTQACKALRAEGYEVVLVNSNPATIMTDPEIADRTYIEPLAKEYLEAIIAAERPDALLPTVGGQTGLNLAVELAEAGVLEKYGVKLIGARSTQSKWPRTGCCSRMLAARSASKFQRRPWSTTFRKRLRFADKLGYPVVIRPSFTLGGTGGSIAYNHEEFGDAIARALDASPVHQALIEESVIGWKEYELEVMRDFRDNFVVICSIENFDPMGVHTGDSITVAPAQTLTDKEYQRMRDAAAAIIRAVGVETGGSNIQFAHRSGNRAHGRHRNESARFAQFRAGLQGHRISHRENRREARRGHDARRNSQRHHAKDALLASSRPSITWSRKFRSGSSRNFPAARPTLTTQMKSVGEVMAIGRTFKEALCKGHSLAGAEHRLARSGRNADRACCAKSLPRPGPDRIHWLFDSRGARHDAARKSASSPRSIRGSLRQMEEMVALDKRAGRQHAARPFRANCCAKSKRSARATSSLRKCGRARPRRCAHAAHELGVAPVFKRVDTCAAEFESSRRIFTPRTRTRTNPTSSRSPENHDPGQRPQPHRAGNRVRLLLLPRVVCAARRWLRNRSW